jgi:hypothetical protein
MRSLRGLLALVCVLLGACAPLGEDVDESGQAVTSSEIRDASRALDAALETLTARQLEVSQAQAYVRAGLSAADQAALPGIAETRLATQQAAATKALETYMARVLELLRNNPDFASWDGTEKTASKSILRHVEHIARIDAIHAKHPVGSVRGSVR